MRWRRRTSTNVQITLNDDGVCLLLVECKCILLVGPIRLVCLSVLNFNPELCCRFAQVRYSTVCKFIIQSNIEPKRFSIRKLSATQAAIHRMLRRKSLKIYLLFLCGMRFDVVSAGVLLASFDFSARPIPFIILVQATLTTFRGDHIGVR